MTAAATPAAPRDGEVANRGLITLSIMLATVMQVLDTTIANVALPSMRGSLGASQDSINWVLTSYIVAAAIMTPMTGWLSDRLGRKRLFLISVGGFTLFSMLCGLSGSLAEMVVFRLMQGVFGAALVPLSQSVLLDINPKEKHGQAMAMWGAGIMVGPILGPTLGGWLTDVLDWRWVFYINVPVGLLAFLGIAGFMPAVGKRLRGFDFLGFALLSLGVGALQMMLDRGEQLDWFASGEIVLELALAVSAFWMFTVHTLTAKDPFIHPGIFRDRNFVTGLVFIFVVGIILLATMALLPPMLSRLFDYSSTTTGLVLAPRGVGTMISMLLVGRLVQKIDARLLILVGLGLTAWSLHMMTQFSPQMDAWPLVESGVIQGLGLGLVFVPLSTMTFATLAPRYRTDGTALFSLMRNIGSSIGISIVTSLLTRNIQINHAVLGGHVTATDPAVRGLIEGLGGSITDPATLSVLDGMVSAQAAMIAYLDDFKLMMFVTLAAVPLLLLLKAPAKKGAAPGVPADAPH
ncbi:DHA2 family efflux MFS transporter permease subunit [Methylobrevis pamukkalensis]|uniref:Multidrug export protein EmrB n=1 Tax=Methylobrevis pamukkalensis TaxID=1439726 RepID=A0A1E3GY29_9HYPH|nr:DHA2 family efflux MFS transporter permease subunit [Methylobrevis pamukkalensis]ODN68960.1 Multidrug export protein EmrB [Methylobrevis pamukkalensis]